MKYYFAPMEGITGYVYRRAHHKYFPGIEKYFSPFLAPGPNKGLTPREVNDILPEHNEGYTLVPQILTNRAEDFIRTGKLLREYGYREINLNLGCPSGTVTAKGKGAGFLAYPGELERFLGEIFEKLDLAISVKTRLGMEEKEEFEELLEIFNQFPMKELVIHPRVRSDFYKKPLKMEAFSRAFLKSGNPVCYNGDVSTKEQAADLEERFPGLKFCMLGRGLLKNPALVREIQGQGGLTREVLTAFHEELLQGYVEVMSGDRNALFKMKELWSHLGENFPEEKKLLKKLKKSQSLAQYREAAGMLLENFEKSCFSKSGEIL